MNEITPWEEIVEMIKPNYYKNKRGRKACGIETMFRMYLLQIWDTLDIQKQRVRNSRAKFNFSLNLFFIII